MKTKQQFLGLVAKELARCGIPENAAPFDNILAFANIIYLTGAIDALQEKQKGAR